LEWIGSITVGSVDPDYIQENKKKNISYLEDLDFLPVGSLELFQFLANRKLGLDPRLIHLGSTTLLLLNKIDL
jgi:hypothetical protein